MRSLLKVMVHPEETLKPPLTGFRLRCGDYRLFLDFTDDNTVEITRIHDRKGAYR